MTTQPHEPEDEQQSHTALVDSLLPTFRLWARATTDLSTSNHKHLIQGKLNALISFFTFADQPPARITSDDVRRWQEQLTKKEVLRRDGHIQRGMSPATIYAWTSRISSFYTWAMSEPALAREIHSNPVVMARPRSPKPYLYARSLSDDELNRLMAVVEERAATGDLQGLRDYALLLFYVLTGMRREEIIRLRWGDIVLRDDGGLIFGTMTMGQKQRARRVDTPSLAEALLAYLTASNRLETMTEDTPLWVRHDPGATDTTRAKRAASANKGLSSVAFEKAMKRYAAEVGISHFHLHRLRHTYARQVAEEVENVETVRSALGHSAEETTRIYLQRVAIEDDQASVALARRLGLRSSEDEDLQTS